jgi:GNAT superfamily N-acetyltransferase
MNQLTKFLVDGILNEGEQRVIAAYGGGFKPPTAGHFEVVKQALKNHPEIDEFIIYVGSGTRDGITQAESVLIWEIYQTYLPMKVRIEPSKAPIGDILRLGKNNPQDKVYFVLGAREENEGDFEDIKNRTRAIGGKHPNVEVKVITTSDKGMSGTNARKLAKVSFENFSRFLPAELSDEEKETAYNIVKSVVKESLNENASYSKDIDIKQRIMQLTQHMLDKGMNIEPLPNVKFVDGDKANAREFLGKTAYYDPNSATIVLYTEGRHPKDIVRSFAHEMIHHIQNLEGRLGNITTTNTQEDDALNDIEAEANLKGTMTFRNWTDTLNESYILQDLENQYGIDLDLYDSGEYLILSRIVIPKNKRGEGIGSKVMNQITQYADKLNKPIYLTPSKDFGATSISRLERFYSQFGFKKKDKSDFSTRETMVRMPLNEGLGDVSLDYIKTKLPKLDSYPKSDIILSKGDFTYINIPQDKDFGMTAEIKAFDQKDGTLVAQSSFDYDKNGKLKGTLDVRPDKRRLGIATEIYKLAEKIIGDTIFPEEKHTEDAEKFWQQKNRSFGPKTDDTLNEKNKPYKHKHGFDDKLGKDPFGLNAYALELARGLEEEIDKDEKNENVAPNHDGKAAPYGSGYKKINEGRYDTLANQLSKIAFQEFKDIHDRGDKEGTFKFRVDHPDEEHDIPAEEFYFDFEGIVKITDDEYNVDGGANVGFDDKGDEITPILSVKFKIPKNPDWQKVSFDIKDVVRHELEHLTQDGDNEKGGAWHEDPRLRRPSKYMQDDQFLRDLIDVNLLPKSDYFKLEKEVDAMLQGMYFKAKKSKTPFKNVLNDYLDIFVDQGSISKEEKENILDVWRSRRKALSLPSF